MNILAFTNGSINVASSRLRSFYLLEPYSSNFTVVLRRFSLSNFYSADILHLQKTFLPGLLALHLLARIFRKKTIYDVDDQPHNSIVWIIVILNCLLANIITVDTLERKLFWKRIFSWKKIIVIPDVLDLDCNENSPIKYPFGDEIKNSVVWIGHPLNFCSIEPFLIVARKSNIRVTIITSSAFLDKYRSKYPEFEFIAWKKDVLFKNLNKWRFMVLNHSGSQSSMMKSDNKMALALVAGLIPIVSDTPEYRRLAADVGYTKFIYSNFDEVPEIIKSCTDDDIKNLVCAQDIIKNKYSANIVANKFQDEVLSRLKAK